MGAASFGIFPMQQFLDANGAPLAGGKLASYVAGTSTPQATYIDSDLAVPHTNPIILDEEGRTPAPVYVQATGYKWLLYDADDVLKVTFDNWSDPGWVFAQNFGYSQSLGAKNVVSGYQILVTDRLVTVSSTGGPNPCLIYLPAAASFTNELVIKNMGTVPVQVTPFGADTLETLASAQELPAASSPIFPSGVFISDNISNWTVTASHGIAV